MNIKKFLIIVLFLIIAVCAQTLFTIYKPESLLKGLVIYMIIFVPLIWGAGHFYSKLK